MRTDGQAATLVRRTTTEAREDDRLSRVGLGDLAAGVDVGGILRHADGSTMKLRLGHSYTAAQLSWFTRGSALNLFTTT